MSDHDWYEVIEGMSLQQGDILRDCPVFAISGSALWPLEVAADVEIEAKVFDLVVMTQSCDLENEKVEDVLLAQLVAWPDAVRVEVARGNEAVRSRKFRKLLIDGNVPGLSLLHQRSSRPVLPWSVVDFHRLFTAVDALRSEDRNGRRPALLPGETISTTATIRSPLTCRTVTVFCLRR